MEAISSTFNVPFSTLPVSETRCPRSGVAFLRESASNLRTLLSSVTNTTGDPASTHFFAHDSNAVGLTQSVALAALELCDAHFSSETYPVIFSALSPTQTKVIDTHATT